MGKVRSHRFNGRLTASTVLEVVISMVLILVVMGMAFMILSNVIRLSLSAKKLKADGILQEELIRISAGNNFNNETKGIDGWRMEKTFKEYPGGTNLLIEADLIIFDETNNKLGELKSVILDENE